MSDATNAGQGRERLQLPRASRRQPGRKVRRRAEYISRSDREIMERGGQPSWEQIRQFEPVTLSDDPQTGEHTPRDREFLENKPPHW